jgi:dihydroorotase
MNILIKGGQLIDPDMIDTTADILIEDGYIKRIEPVIDAKAGKVPSDMTVLEMHGRIITPGLIDLHVHFREPGHEYKETIQTGCQAAAAGGFTGVCTMPNTEPVNDNQQVTEFILKQSRRAGGAKIFPIATISRGSKGIQLSDFGELKAAGAVGVSDDGLPVMDSQLMRHALEYARQFGLLVISHCEDLNLLADGVMNEGFVATRLGLAGIPNVCESVMVMRDIALAELTRASVHIAHVSTRESVRAIRDAKKLGIPVTAETAPHYFTLTDEAVEGYDTHAKMNPPLRSRQDREAIRNGLADGTIDVIATDHAPHSSFEKDIEFDNAANGIIGLETSLPISLQLVRDGVLSLAELIDKMAVRPAQILGIDNHLTVGNPADLTIIDPDYQFTIDAGQFRSLSRNTPFDGWQVQGKAVMTMVNGRIVFDEINPQ